MGLGTLFIGYFLLVNISYFAYTDIISAFVCLLAFYKLSRFNRPLYTGAVCSLIFALFGVYEIVIEVLKIFYQSLESSETVASIGSMRYIIISAITVCALLGIKQLAEEVGADALAVRAKNTLPLSLVFVLAAIFEFPPIGRLLGTLAGYVYFAMIIFILITLAVNLVTIYKAYMQICMPEDLNAKQKESRFGFVNKFREYEAGKSREYAEYKLEKMKARAEKKLKKGQQKNNDGKHE